VSRHLNTTAAATPHRRHYAAPSCALLQLPVSDARYAAESTGYQYDGLRACSKWWA
jgi:hypothetical protein